MRTKISCLLLFVLFGVVSLASAQAGTAPSKSEAKTQPEISKDLDTLETFEKLLAANEEQIAEEKASATPSDAKILTLISERDAAQKQIKKIVDGLPKKMRKDWEKLQTEKKLTAAGAKAKAQVEAAPKTPPVDKVAERRQKAMAEISQRAQIIGCPAGTVQVSGGAENYTKFASLLTNMVVIRIVNDGAAISSIETPFKGYGPIVANLCPGGSITLSFLITPADPPMVNVPLMVVGRLPGGKTISQTRTFELYQNQYPQVNNQTWEVHLNR